jgi:hypothetical protein
MTRVDGLRRDLVERNKHKGTLSEPRMRYLESCLAEAEVAQHQDIQVQCTWTVGDTGGAVAAEIAFEGKKLFEQSAGRKIGIERQNCIQEARLIGKAHWPCGIKRGARDDASESREAVRCGGEGGFGSARGALEV